MKARKEITLAIIIGLLVGLVVVGGIIRARSALMDITPPELPFKRSSTPSPSPSTTELFLTLDTPDNQVSSVNSLTIKGTTLPGTYIVILGELEEYIIVPNDLGQFSQETTLTPGANTIKVTSYQTNGEKREATLSAVFTTSDI